MCFWNVVIIVLGLIPVLVLLAVVAMMIHDAVKKRDSGEGRSAIANLVIGIGFVAIFVVLGLLSYVANGIKDLLFDNPAVILVLVALLVLAGFCVRIYNTRKSK